MTAEMPEVAVIIAAYNCERTVGRAIRSALGQAEVREVIVVDDASTDGTAAAAAAANDGSGRLTVVKQETNSGPAAARNRAIGLSRSAHIAVLDADDYLLPDRFKPLFRIAGWDMIADNIAFISEDSAGRSMTEVFAPDPVRVRFAQFIEGNISRAGRARAELGFVKPVIRREFLDRAGLGYDESLRIGEDYALYALMLAAGARFVRCRPCGYVAIEREDSLSGCHETRDLEALLAFDDRLADHPELSRADRRPVCRHRRHLLSKVHHRQILDRRQEGLIPALTAALARPGLLPRLAVSVARDKLRWRRRRQEVRYLFS